MPSAPQRLRVDTVAVDGVSSTGCHHDLLRWGRVSSSLAVHLTRHVSASTVAACRRVSATGGFRGQMFILLRLGGCHAFAAAACRTAACRTPTVASWTSPCSQRYRLPCSGLSSTDVVKGKGRSLRSTACSQPHRRVPEWREGVGASGADWSGRECRSRRRQVVPAERGECSAGPWGEQTAVRGWNHGGQPAVPQMSAGLAEARTRRRLLQHPGPPSLHIAC